MDHSLSHAPSLHVVRRRGHSIPPTVPMEAADGNGQVLSVRRRCCPSRHQAARIRSMAATKKMRPKINAGNVI